MNGGEGKRKAAYAPVRSPFQMDWLGWVLVLWRRALPQYGNGMILMMRGMVIARLVTMTEVFGLAKDIDRTFYVTYEGIITAALIYIALTDLIIQISKHI